MTYKFRNYFLISSNLGVNITTYVCQIQRLNRRIYNFFLSNLKFLKIILAHKQYTYMICDTSIIFLCAADQFLVFPFVFTIVFFMSSAHVCVCIAESVRYVLLHYF